MVQRPKICLEVGRITKIAFYNRSQNLLGEEGIREQGAGRKGFPDQVSA